MRRWHSRGNADKGVEPPRRPRAPLSRLHTLLIRMDSTHCRFEWHVSPVQRGGRLHERRCVDGADPLDTSTPLRSIAASIASAAHRMPSRHGKPGGFGSARRPHITCAVRQRPDKGVWPLTAHLTTSSACQSGRRTWEVGRRSGDRTCSRRPLAPPQPWVPQQAGRLASFARLGPSVRP